MSDSYYDMDQNPELAGSLWTTGADYLKFLEALYYHRVLPAEIIKEMESDHTPSSAVQSSKKSWGLGMAVGHYSFANWLECDVSLPEPQPFRPECYEKSIHTSPGVFGYYPLIDRFNRYWMQVGIYIFMHALSLLLPHVGSETDKAGKDQERPTLIFTFIRVCSILFPPRLRLSTTAPPSSAASTAGPRAACSSRSWTR